MIDPPLPHSSDPPLSDRLLRQFAGLWILFFAGLAAWQILARENRSWAVVLGIVGLVVGLGGLVRPRAIRPVYGGALKIAHPIGWLVSNFLLTVLFFVVLVPMGLFQRLVGRDPLRLRRRPDTTETYLTPRPAPTGLRSYFRQS